MLDRITRSITSRVSPRTNSSPVVIAVTSPYGSTGKTTVAINIALELAYEKARVLLIDGDIQGPAVANLFALTQQPAGLQAALRIAGQQRFDLEQLERLSFQFQKSTLRIMPGSQNFPSQPIDQSAIANLLETARSGYEFTVVDLGSLSVDGSGTQAELTNTIISLADRTVMVCLADPIGIFRLLGIENLIAATSQPVDLVMNRVRNSVIASARREIAITLQRLSALEPKAYLPDDPQHIDQAVRTGVPATSLSRTGTFRQALTGFVRAELLGRKGALDSRVAKLG
ncbi:flhG Antiactivator of flagellar biosynthesis FleN, an ATPase [Microbacteriaceae bacterium]